MSTKVEQLVTMKASRKLEKLREMKPDSLVFRLAEWTYKLAKKGRIP